MRNPWAELPLEPPFVLPGDRAAIHRFNDATKKPEHRLRLECLPEPFVGQIDAPIVILLLNPSFGPTDIPRHQRPDFAHATRRNLLHQPQDYPFYFLDPRLARGDAAVKTSGFSWWSKELKGWISEFGAQLVASNVLGVEYFPYHSASFDRRNVPSVSSQSYSVYLVERAMDRGALIIRMWGEKRVWPQAVPALQRYDRLYGRENRGMSPVISAKNCPKAYEAGRQILSGLGEAQTGSECSRAGASSSSHVSVSSMFQSIRTFLLALGDDVREVSRSSYTAFERRRRFAVVSMNSSDLRLNCHSDWKTLVPEPGFTRDMRRADRGDWLNLEIRVRNAGDLEKAKSLLQRSYDLD